MGLRQEKIATLVKKELSILFQEKGMRAYDGTMVTVTVVRVSPDLGVAKAYLSLFTQKDKNEILDLIKADVNWFKNEIAKKVKNQLRKMPDLIFYLDDSLDKAEEIDNLLKK